MTITEILKELEPYTGRFPTKAMKAAIEQREAIIPDLLRVLEAVANDPAKWAAEHEDYMLHVFAVHLLAQFSEKRAYPLLVKIVSAPGEVPFDLFGDTVTEGLKQLFASLYDGDPAPLQGLVESEDVNEFVRDAAIDAFLVLEHTGQMPRDAVAAYFRSLFQGRLRRTPSYAWSGLVCAVADLPAPELLEEVRQAYADGLVDTMVADLEGLEQDIISQKPPRRDRHALITDAIAEMEWWAAFHPEDSRPQKQPMPDKQLPPPSPPLPASYVAPKRYVSEPKIGRNDSCPCGSGKKYRNVAERAERGNGHGQVNLAAEAINAADAILVTAGAGMGVDSGLPDFRGTQGFWRAYPAIAKLGLLFEDMANPAWFSKNPHLAWAFYGHRLNLYRRTTPHAGFSQLLEIGASKSAGYFVFTSNVDGQFQKAGFAPERIVECHGSIHHFQCAASCTDEIWDAADATVNIEESSFRALEPLPKCRNCPALARPNILMFGDWSWLGHRAEAQQKRLSKWLNELAKSSAKLVVVELGAGSTILTVRHTSDRVAERLGGKLIRINPREHEVLASTSGCR